MVKIRLSRVGAKKEPKYRIVVADEQEKRNGKFIELIGYYDPMRNPPEIKVQTDRYQHWLSVGAQPTKSVVHLVKSYERAGRVLS